MSRSINGLDFANHLIRNWDYRQINQNGSHMMIRTDVPSSHTATIPKHKPMKTGTFAGILKQIAEHKQVDREDILRDL